MKHKFSLISSLFRIKLMRFIILELLAVLTSLFTVVSVGIVAAIIAGYIYDTNHGISNPVVREDDLGSGLIMIKAVVASLLLSIPASVAIHFFIFKKFFKGVE